MYISIYKFNILIHLIYKQVSLYVNLFVNPFSAEMT